MTRARLLGLLAAVAFVAEAVALLPLLGIENDESLFGSALYAPAVGYSLAGVPLMLMSYVGALKGLLYAPVFHWWAPGAYSIRLPMAIVGGLTVWLFFLLLRRVAGDRVAVIGAALLATDSLFVLTTVFDWGPVALQHLFLVAGCLLCLQETTSRLAAGFFLFGLALWDKALFAWPLAGLAVALIVVFPREITCRRAAVAIPAFCAGALPLILYNLSHGFETFRANSSFAPSEIAPKFGFLIDSTLSGIADWMIAGKPIARASLLGVAFAAAVVLWLVAWRRSKLLCFAMIFLVVTWIQMAVTRNAGASVHHTVLMWPFPQLFIAAALGFDAPDWRRTAATAAAVILIAWNLAVLADYRALMLHSGPSVVWTDAIYPLASALKDEPAEVYAVDWGIIENVTLLDQGRVPVQPAWIPLTAQQLSSPRALFVGHTDGNEIFPGSNEKFRAQARAAGFEPVAVRTISGRDGTPIFQIMRMEAKPAESRLRAGLPAPRKQRVAGQF